METPHISLSSPCQTDIGEDPWDARVQAGCLQGAGSSQPLVLSTPRDHYHALRSSWARRSLFGESIPESLLKNPLGKTFQPSQALAGKPFPALFPSGAAISETGFSWKEGRVPHLAECCQLALLWAHLGKNEAAQKLAGWISGFLHEKPFFSLWRREKEFDEKEDLLSFSLLCRALGWKEKAASYLKQVQGPIDPFFLALAKLIPSIQSVDQKKKWSDPYLGISYHTTDEKSAALTLCGKGTSLGAYSAKDVEIRAMGPQALPLTSLDGFGIDRLPDGAFMTGWTRLFAFPEVWMHLKTDDWLEELTLKFRGMKLEEPLAFVFYIKAGSCAIGSQIFKPKSLQRYLGDSRSFVFRGKESQIKIETAMPHKAQLIPLAGEGGFWNADFLLSFEIQPFEAQANFTIQ